MRRRFINTLLGSGLLAAAALPLTGCSLDIPYDNQFSDPDAITTPETGRELLAYAYSSIPNIEFDLALLSDDFQPTYWASRNPTLNNEYTWQRQALIDLSASVWPEYYSVIATVNALTERIPDIKVSSDADRREVADLTSECATLKAYCYFQLLRLYAADPTGPQGLEADGIVLKDRLVMEDLPRSTVSECVAEIRRLLDVAAESGHQGTDPSWLTADATRLLRAEVELYAGNYAEAAEMAEALLNERGYSCFGPDVYRNLWDGTQCDERIFVYNNPDVSQSFYQGIVYDTNTGDYYSVPESIATDFTEGDCRTVEPLPRHYFGTRFPVFHRQVQQAAPRQAGDNAHQQDASIGRPLCGCPGMVPRRYKPCQGPRGDEPIPESARRPAYRRQPHRRCAPQ